MTFSLLLYQPTASLGANYRDIQHDYFNRRNGYVLSDLFKWLSVHCQRGHVSEVTVTGTVTGTVAGPGCDRLKSRSHAIPPAYGLCH
eukprot:3088638-Rhodomonas_salina.1